MTKLRETKGRAPRARRQVARLLLLLFACAACAFASADAARAQSGRRSPTMSKTSPPPPVSEKSGGATTAATKKDVKPLASFVLLEDAGTVFEVDFTARRIVLASFAEQLDRSALVAVTRGGRSTRKEARDRAKEQKEAFVVLIELEEESPGVNMRTDSRRQQDSTLTIKTYVYTPATGDLKFSDRFVSRPYNSRATVGGVRVPTGGYPTQAQLEQSGRDAAQRLLTHFQIALPPEIR